MSRIFDVVKKLTILESSFNVKWFYQAASPTELWQWSIGRLNVGSCGLTKFSTDTVNGLNSYNVRIHLHIYLFHVENYYW